MKGQNENMQPIPLARWHEMARELFGNDARHWRFVCPVCNTIQTAQDFIDAGCPEDEAKMSIAVECVGRWLPKEKSQKAFGENRDGFFKGKPCDFAGYGLFKLNPIPVLFEDGKIMNAFAFAETS